MGQLTIYLDNDTEKKMREAAKRSGLSYSKWVTELIRNRTATQWPANIARLAGAWEDFPLAEDIREAAGKDCTRETF